MESSESFEEGAENERGNTTRRSHTKKISQYNINVT